MFTTIIVKLHSECEMWVWENENQKWGQILPPPRVTGHVVWLGTAPKLPKNMVKMR